MAEIIENKKGFKVIKVTLNDCLNWGGLGICDWCNECIGEYGYYVAVLNSVMCEKCYLEWYERAKNYPEDKRIEDGNFAYMKLVLNL